MNVLNATELHTLPWIEKPTLKHTLAYVKQPASGNSLCDAGAQSPSSVTTERGEMGWEVKKGGHEWIPMANSY